MKIQSTGGFGNQLFQWTYAHHLKIREEGREVLVFRDSIHTANRESHLGLLADQCSHQVHFGSSEVTGRILQGLDKSSNFSPHFYRLISALFGIATETNTGRLEDITQARSRIVRGFFQYPEQMFEAVTLVLSELESAILLQVKREKEPHPYQLIHIRRRDFVDNKETHGVLSIEHYRRALSDNLPLIVIGDEDEPPKELSSIGKSFVYRSPKECNEYEAMFLALNCEKFIMANSTFSWWCGLLASSKGKVVFIPNPWTRTPQAMANYSFPRLTPLESIFL